MSRKPLMKLTNQGLAAIDTDFLCGKPEQLADEASYATRTGYETAALEVLKFDDAPTTGPSDDPKVAVELHRLLGIQRGLASEPRMWAWLATRHAAGYLRRRWSKGGRPPNRNRFVGRLVDNGLARLWWAAELTQERDTTTEEHFKAIKKLLMSQYRTDRLLSMVLVRHPPVLLGVLDAIGSDIRWQVLNEICRRLGLLATTYAIDTMSRVEAQVFIGRLYREVVAGRDFSSEDEPGQ